MTKHLLVGNIGPKRQVLDIEKDSLPKFMASGDKNYLLIPILANLKGENKNPHTARSYEVMTLPDFDPQVILYRQWSIKNYDRDIGNNIYS